MKIANDFQFKIYFYNYLAASDMVPDCIEIEYYENKLKDYLMYHGFKSFIRNENNCIVSYIYRDFDELLQFYQKYGDI